MTLTHMTGFKLRVVLSVKWGGNLCVIMDQFWPLYCSNSIEGWMKNCWVDGEASQN